MSQSELQQMSESFARVIVSNIQIACGDGIKEDVRKQRLVTTNSVPNRIWDLLNTALHENASLHNYIAEATKRGLWQILPLFDPQSELLLTIMREARFKELCRYSPSKRGYHYLQCLSNVLNADLISGEKQLRMEQIAPPDLDFEIAHKIVADILGDLHISAHIVRHHALVLFSASGYEVRSVRCIRIDGNLDIVDQIDWCKYLVFTPSDIPDTISDATSVHNKPAQGLNLTQKAKDRKGQSTELPYKRDAEKEDLDN